MYFSGFVWAWVWMSVSLCSYMHVYVSLMYFHMVSLGVGVLSACMAHCVGGCHLCMGFLLVWVSVT